MINECLDPDCRAHGELHRLREAREALTRRVKRLEDRAAELYEENRRLQYALDDIMWGGAHLDIRASMQNALQAAEAERDALRAAVERVRALCDEAEPSVLLGIKYLTVDAVLAALEGGDGNGDKAGNAH